MSDVAFAERPLEVDDEAPRTGRGRRALAYAILGLFGFGALAVFLVVAIFPTRLWLDQREAVSDARDELTRLESEEAELTARAEELRDPDAVELAAREQFLLTRPGDELFVVRPPDAVVIEVPDGWPFEGVERLLNGD